jgi:hypothetical protein
MQMQIQSLRTLLPALAPGGVFFMEDLQTSMFDKGSQWRDEGSGPTTAQYLAQMVHHMHDSVLHNEPTDEGRFPDLAALVPLIKSIDCFRELCVLSRWPEGEPREPPQPKPGI